MIKYAFKVKKGESGTNSKNTTARAHTHTDATHTPVEQMRQLCFWIEAAHLWSAHKIPLRITSLNRKIPRDKGNIWQPPSFLPPPLYPLSLSLWGCCGWAIPFEVSIEQGLNSTLAWLTDSDSRRYYHANSLRWVRAPSPLDHRGLLG